jgi:peptidyl-prolyl cis-trans isomerase D
MFDVFRSQRKSVKYVLGFIMGMVGLSMVITMVPGLFSTPTADLGNPVLVEVGDEQVTIQDVQLQLRQMLPPGQDVSQLMGLMAGQAIEALVNERVLLAEADRMGLKPNDRQLAEWLRGQLPNLFPGGQFDALQYTAMVQQRFAMTVPQFERQLLVDLAVRSRLQGMIADSVVVTEDEIRADYSARNEQARIEYVLVPILDYRDEVDTSDENIQEFFNSNRFRYQTQETRSAKLITFVSSPTPNNVEVSEGEISTFYDQNRFRFETPERVRPRHMLFMTLNPDTGVPLTDSETAAKRALADDLLTQVHAGGDFAALADEHSDDPGTKGQGGDLGWVARGQMGSPAIEDATFALQADEVSEVVETEYGFQIVQMQEREAAQRRPLEAVREEIVVDLQFERNALAEQARLDDALAALRGASPETVDDVAAGLGFRVETFTGFEHGRAPSQLARIPTLLNSVFSAAIGEVLPHATATDMTAVMLTDIAPVRDLTYEEASGRARLDYVSAEARKLAEAAAAELLTEAKTSSLAAAAAERSLEVVTSDLFRRDGMVAGLGNGQLLSGAFTASPGELYGPVSASGGFGVYLSVAVEPADMAAFVVQRASLREQLTQQRRTEAFSIFQDEVLSRYEANGEIMRYDSRIQQFIDAASRPAL